MGRDHTFDEQIAECRELLAEVRGATKDLRQAIKDAKATFPELAQEQISKYVDQELGVLSAQTTAFIQAAEQRIAARFDRLANLLLTGTESGKPKPGDVNIEHVIEQLAVRRTLNAAIEEAVGNRPGKGQ